MTTVTPSVRRLAASVLGVVPDGPQPEFERYRLLMRGGEQ